MALTPPPTDPADALTPSLAERGRASGSNKGPEDFGKHAQGNHSQTSGRFSSRHPFRLPVARVLARL